MKGRHVIKMFLREIGLIRCSLRKEKVYMHLFKEIKEELITSIHEKVQPFFLPSFDEKKK